MSNRLYLNGSEVRIIDFFSQYNGQIGVVKDYNPKTDEYLVHRNSTGMFDFGFTEWFDVTDLFPIKTPSPNLFAGYNGNPFIEIDRAALPPLPSFGKRCSHSWKPTLLLSQTVYDCSKCGMKKEEFDKEEKDSF